MNQKAAAEKSTAEAVATETSAIGESIGATGAAVAAQAGAVADAARDALADMRRIVDRFAAVTGEKAGVAADAVGTAGAETAERVGALVGEARDFGRDGIDALSDAIAKRPLCALAAAAGVGIVLGMIGRSGAGR